MVNGEQQLPDGWVLDTLGNVTKINGRDIAIRELSDNLPVTFVPMAAVDAEKGVIAQPEDRPLKDVRNGFTPFSNGDVLLAKITPSMENGKAAIARNLKNGRGFGSTEFHVFRPKEVVTAEWIFHFIRQEHFRKDAKAHFAGTAGQLRVPASFLIDYPIPVPPLPEQERIIAKIEELFTLLEAGTSALAKVQAGLRRYKASVLKAAVEGKLGIQNDEFRIGEGELPDGWRWTTLEEVSSDANYGTSQKCDYAPTKFPVVRIPNIVSGAIDVNDLKYAIDGSGLREKDSLASGDLLIIRTNGSKDLIGRSAMIHKTFDSPLYFASYLIRYKITDHENIGAWISTIWNSPFIRAELEKMVATTAGQYNLNIAKLNKLSIPLPPLEEQRRIVAEVERRLSVARQVENIVEKALVRASRLRQAVLKSAFEGRL